MINDPDAETINADRQLEYPLYQDHRKLLWDAEYDSGKRFDQWLITVAGGAIAISMTFLKDFVSSDQTESPTLLLFSWIGMGCAIAATLVSIILSQRGFEKTREDLDDAFASPAPNALARSRQAYARRKTPKCIALFNRLSILFFLVGLILLFVFTFLNITRAPRAATSQWSEPMSDKMRSQKLTERPVANSAKPPTAPVLQSTTKPLTEGEKPPKPPVAPPKPSK